MFTRMRVLVLGFFAVGFLFLDVGATRAMAQYGPYAGDVSTWSGYAPGTTWGGYAPGGYVYVNPAAPPRPNTSWSGYAPGAAWQAYQPGTVYYQPGTVVQPQPIAPNGVVRYAPAQAPVRTSVTRPSAARSSFNASTYREFGSGRNVFMHKPWLPGQP